MRFLLLLTLAPILWSKPVVLNFSDVTNFNAGAPRALRDFYAGEFVDYGIHSVGGYRDPMIYDGTLQFPLHGPGVLYVEPGFHNFLTFQYTGYLPFSPFASLVLRYQGNIVQQILLPTTAFGVYNTETVTVNGMADEIWFGVNPNGMYFGNAGDLEYREIDVDLVDPPPPPVMNAAPTSIRLQAAPTVKSPTRARSPQSARPQARTQSQRVR